MADDSSLPTSEFVVASLQRSLIYCGYFNERKVSGRKQATQTRVAAAVPYFYACANARMQTRVRAWDLWSAVSVTLPFH